MNVKTTMIRTFSLLSLHCVPFILQQTMTTSLFLQKKVQIIHSFFFIVFIEYHSFIIQPNTHTRIKHITVQIGIVETTDKIRREQFNIEINTEHMHVFISNTLYK